MKSTLLGNQSYRRPLGILSAASGSYLRPRFFSARASAAVIASTIHASNEAGPPSSTPSMYAARHRPAMSALTRAVTLTIRSSVSPALPALLQMVVYFLA